MKTDRVVFLDLARGLAVFFMIMQHGMIVYAVNEGEGTFIGDLIVLSGTAPAAPVFMLIMGIFFLKAGNLNAIVFRGLKLIFLGYVLNIFRFVLPALISGEYTGSGPDSPMGLFMSADILQLAGLSLIIMSSLRKMGITVWVCVTMYVSLMSPLLWRFAPHNQILDLLWGTHHNVAFPLFPWLIYPLVGMIWGQLFYRVDSVNRFMRQTAIAGMGFLIFGGAIWAWADIPWMPLGEYNRCGFQGHLMIIGFVFIWLWLMSCLEKAVVDTKVSELLAFWSRHVTVVYMIQWILIGWGMLVFNYQQLSSEKAALLGIAAVFLTHGITKMYLKLKPKHRLVRG